jgi:monoamine oxidase
VNEEHGADVIIVGAGLAGLTAASLLARAGRRVIVLEAAARPGGRIRSLTEPGTGRVLGDLGPSWVWPPYQPVVARWLQDLGAGTFDQYNIGNAALDYGPGQPVQYQPLPGQHGMMRIDGGPQALVDGLLAQLPAGAVRTGQSVVSISQDSSGVQVETSAGVFTAGQAIIAAPLRVAGSSIRFSPALPDELVQEIKATPTWMAVHAKTLAVYERPFWREAGLSGRIASRAGPLVEAHDLCGAGGTPAAIFGFVGWPHEVREQHRPQLQDAIIAQLVRCFGSKAAKPLHLHVEDWALNPHICSPLDKAGAMPHPDVGSPLLRQACGRVQFAVSETSDVSPGLIEGAFAAGMRAASLLAN